MADEIIYKKMTRKADKSLENKIIAKHGKQANQKLKTYVVLEYLLKYSDENNTKSAYDIIGYLEDCGISAERRSIYRDIEDIDRIIHKSDPLPFSKIEVQAVGLVIEAGVCKSPRSARASRGFGDPLEIRCPGAKAPGKELAASSCRQVTVHRTVPLNFSNLRVYQKRDIPSGISLFW